MAGPGLGALFVYLTELLSGRGACRSRHNHLAQSVQQVHFRWLASVDLARLSPRVMSHIPQCFLDSSSTHFRKLPLFDPRDFSHKYA